MRKIHIPEGCKNIVIFVHGFGVRWDSRGMFTDIASSLPTDWGYVLFDLYDVNGNNIYILPMSEQSRRVETTYEEVTQQHPEAQVYVIAHSMGCIVALLANLKNVAHIALLAPPSTFGDGALEECFTNYPGAKKQGDTLIVPRRDGTTSIIPSDFFIQMKGTDPMQVVSAEATKYPTTIIVATNDELIDSRPYKQLEADINCVDISADHNFTGDSRQKLLNSLSQILAE